MTPTLPMPAEEELNKMFLELVDELDLTQANRQAVLALPANKKWQIYCSRKGNDTLDNGGLRTTDLSGDPEDYINRIKVIADATFNEDNEELSNHMRQVEALKTALRTQPHSFVLRFIELDGLNALLKVLGTIDVEAAHSYLHTSVIGCLKALMNNSVSIRNKYHFKSNFNFIIIFYFVLEWKSSCTCSSNGNKYNITITCN